MFYFSVINTVKFISGPGLSVLACPWRLCVRYDDLTMCVGSSVCVCVCVCVYVWMFSVLRTFLTIVGTVKSYTTSKSTFASP